MISLSDIKIRMFNELELLDKLGHRVFVRVGRLGQDLLKGSEGILRVLPTFEIDEYITITLKYCI